MLQYHHTKVSNSQSRGHYVTNQQPDHIADPRKRRQLDQSRINHGLDQYDLADPTLINQINQITMASHTERRKEGYLYKHSVSHVSSHSFSSLAINLRLHSQSHRTVVRGLHASLTNRLLWLYSWLPTITVTLKSRTPYRLYLSLRYRFVTGTLTLWDVNVMI